MTKQDKNIDSIYPLSPMQQGMLFHTLLAPKSGVYFNQVLFAVTGSLHEADFRHAWQQMVDRHEPLRTLFVWEGQEKPLQVVRRRVALPWQKLDWRGLSADEQTVKLEEFLRADRQRGLDLAQAPLMRLTLIRMEENRYELIWSHHHILIDGWSMFLLLKEVMAIYQALMGAQDCRLEPVRPYREFINWLEDQDYSKAEQFWRGELKGFVVPTPLVGDRVDTAHGDGGFDVAQQLQRSSSSLMTALRSFGGRNGLTLSTLIHGAWALLLSRYSGESDVVFGSTVSGRPAEFAGAEPMVGLFINTLPVRAWFSQNDLVLPWLKDFQDRLLELRQYEHSPLVEVQGWSDVPRDQPLFESLLVFENYPVDASVWGQDEALQISNMRVVGPTNFPLGVVVVPRKELAIKVQYDPRRFDAAAITRMIGHFNTLLEGIVSNPEQRLSELPLLTNVERQQLLVEWNRTEVAYPKDRCLHELIEEQVERTPEAVAVVFEDTQLTYRQLNERANQLAHYLRSLGVRPEQLVGVCMERSLEMVVGLLGILKAGGAYVPLDPTYPRGRLAYMLEDTRTPVLLTKEQFLPVLPENGAKMVCLDSRWEPICRESATNLPCMARSEDLAYVIYTSGSTGLPKGVMITHRALVNYLDWCVRAYPVFEGSGAPVHSSIAFDLTITGIFAPLLVGRRVLLIPEELGVHGLGETLLKETTFSLVKITPSHLVLLLQQLPSLCATGLTRSFIIGGENLLAENIIFWQEFSPDTVLINEYGPTEATVGCCVYRVPRNERRSGSVPIGRPINNTQLYILDGFKQPVPVGVPGELYIGGAGLARGYLNQPELTAEKFSPDPFTKRAGARLYKTGDLARYLPDGNIEYLGRLDCQVKIRGFRIELGEIESVLVGHPSVQEAVAVVREDVPGDKRLIAYVIRNAESKPIVEELRDYLKAKLPDYMVPSSFVFLEALPLTPNGKVDRRALPAPDSGRRDLEIAYVPPGTPVELALSRIWTEVLRVERVGIHDNFFELGGHSLLATQIVSRIRHVLRVDFPLRTFFQGPTVAQLTQFMDAVNSAADSTEPLSDKDYVVI